MPRPARNDNPRRLELGASDGRGALTRSCPHGVQRVKDNSTQRPVETRRSPIGQGLLRQAVEVARASVAASHGGRPSARHSMWSAPPTPTPRVTASAPSASSAPRPPLPGRRRRRPRTRRLADSRTPPRALARASEPSSIRILVPVEAAVRRLSHRYSVPRLGGDGNASRLRVSAVTTCVLHDAQGVDLQLHLRLGLRQDRGRARSVRAEIRR